MATLTRFKSQAAISWVAPPEEMQNAEAYIIRSQQDGKTGGGPGEPTPPPRRGTRGSHSPDRQGLSNLPGRAVPGWAADRKLSIPGPYGLWKNSRRGGD